MLAGVVASSHVAVCLVDPDFRVVHANDTFTGALTTAGEDGSDAPVDRSYFDLVGLGDATENAMRQALAAGTTYAADELRAATGAGDVTYWDVDVVPVTNDAPEIGEGADAAIAAVITMVDRTERAMARESLMTAHAQLAERAAELERSNKDLTEFAYVASHDLGAPLRTIGGFAKLLASRYEGRLDTEADEFIEFILSGVAQMQRLIDDLLVYSRVNTRGQPPQPVDVSAVVTEALGALHGAIRQSEAVVSVDPLPVVTADGGQLRQVFQNLIANAITFVAPGTKPVVRVSAARQGNAWRFTVADNGIGIPEQHRERVFGMFQRLHSDSEYPGTGIGLAVCKRIVTRHHGVIWVEDNDGGGSRFSFTIPDVSQVAGG